MHWNYHLNHHFGSCRLLATGYDPHMKSEVRYYLLPGDFDNIGVTDGTNSHVVPITTISPSINRLQGLIDEVRQGGNPAVKAFDKPGGQKRHTVDLDAVEEFRPRAIKRSRLDESALA